MKKPVPLNLPTQLRASTGIAGLDDVMGGGFPAHHLYLIEGEPGAGKTTLGIQFLLEGVARGESGLYVTLSETGDELRTVAASHGWTLDGLKIFELLSVEGLSPDAEQSILHPSEVELGETTRGVMAEVEKSRPTRVVFDSLSEMRLLAQDPLRYRRQILALKHFFATRGCTVLMLDDKSAREGDLQLHSIAHGVLSLSQTLGEYGEDKRFLRVAKLRGVKFRGGEHDFRLDTGGISVFPRLVAAEHHVRFSPAAASTGNAGLDAMLGGGLTYGSNTLFAGPSGVGKTTTAMACLAAALARGEKVSYYLFDEGVGTLLTRCDALGIDIRSYLDNSQFDLVSLDPAQVSAGEFANMVREAVEERGVSVLGIDSLNAYLQAMPGGKFLMLQMHELLTYLNQRGIATILVLGQHGLFGDGRSDIDVSYLSDAILSFRYFEARGSLLKALSVVKSRTSRHELTIREFRLGADGVDVGDALTDFEGVMNGVATYRGHQPLLSDGPAIAKA
ncbi:circadian clock protein KaiC [Pigmentiphaga aceris]|uniref:non-specific serine/threonine protein kinase n=1 Tax=Pigmentiphaga aceris TaxID=1940612 RepID=A0A5C0AWW5_9BURK|nr:ATPase domain-containing protein [Pigmentiphaga aceris]QEI05201.1 circadian clock protein KaiC [Pigmentiphaga aceris]